MNKASQKITSLNEDRIKIHIDHDQEMGKLPVDILEKDHEILIQTPIAGVNLDETEIIISDDVLTIKGKRSADFEAFGYKDKDHYVRECFWGEFSRSVILPANVDANAIEATERDHVLYIRIPKKDRVSMRIIKIKKS